jgi:hypothetical protein
VTDAADSSPARGYEFEQFVREIVARSPDLRLESPPRLRNRDSGLDIAAARDGQPLLIEVKATSPQTRSRLEQMISQLRAAADHYLSLNPGPKPRLVLAIPGVLATSKYTVALLAGVDVWDGQRLRRWADELGISVPAYVAAKEPAYVTFEELDTSSAEVGHVPDWDHALLRSLDSIPKGRHGWAAYEKFCEDLLNFLFVPPLNPAIPQSPDGQHANRRDYILPNYSLDGGFWQFMRSHYEAHFVVAEVKNLTDAIRKEEVLQVANYLNQRGTGLFAMILGRNHMNDTAKWTRREQWVQHGKMIISLDDDDVRQMITTKLVGNDPAEMIRQKVEDFRLAI